MSALNEYTFSLLIRKMQEGKHEFIGTNGESVIECNTQLEDPNRMLI